MVLWALTKVIIDQASTARRIHSYVARMWIYRDTARYSQELIHRA